MCLDVSRKRLLRIDDKGIVVVPSSTPLVPASGKTAREGLTMSKPTVKTAKKAAIKAFNQYIRERDNFTCFICGKVGDRYSMDAGHLITAAREATRFDELNTNCSCKGCNIKHEHDYEPYRKKFVDKYGEAVYNAMYARSFKYVGRRVYDYIELRKEYEDKLKSIIAEAE